MFATELTAMSLDADMMCILVQLNLDDKALRFLKSLGGKNISDFALAIEEEDLTKQLLWQHGVRKIPASKLIRAIKQVWRYCFIWTPVSTIFFVSLISSTNFFTTIPNQHMDMAKPRPLQQHLTAASPSCPT